MSVWIGLVFLLLGSVSCANQSITARDGTIYKQTNFGAVATLAVDPKTGVVTMASDGTEVGGLAVKTAGSVAGAMVVADAYKAVQKAGEQTARVVAKEGTKQAASSDALAKGISDNAVKAAAVEKAPETVILPVDLN